MVVLALFLGCNKGKNAAEKKAETGKSLTSTADTADIFKEFYSEDTAKKGPAKKTSGKIAKNETFSPSSAASSPAEFSENGRYVVQVSCVKSQRFAEKMAGGLKDKGYPAYVSEVQNPTPNLSGAYYRIRIGGFNAFSVAKAFGENTLSQNGYQYWVDKKSNDKVGMEGYGLGAGSGNGNATSSYESAAPASSSWSGSSESPASSQSSSSSSVSPSSSSATSSSASSSSSPFTPETPPPAAPAPEKASAATNSGTGSQSQPAAPASQPSTPPAASSTTSGSSAAPAPSSSTAEGSTKSSGAGSGSSDWGADSSATGSGW
jgi:hypothetical protein